MARPGVYTLFVTSVMGCFLSGCLEIRGVHSAATDASSTSSTSTLSHVIDKVQAGRTYACLQYENDLYCWGNLNAQPSSNILQLVRVGGLAIGSVTDFAAGLDTLCVVTNGAVNCVGENSDYQLGQGVGDTSDHYTFKEITASGAVHVWMGRYDGCYSDASGAIYCWGGNYNGELGRGNYSGVYTPSLTYSAGVVDMNIGDSHSCLLLSTGVVKCAGYNGEGQIGTTSFGSDYTSWTTVVLPSSAVALIGSQSHDCALLDTGVTYCWGYGGFYEIGNGVAANNNAVTLATQIPANPDRIFALLHRTCFLKSNQIKCVGENRDHTLDFNTATPRSSATLINLSGTPKLVVGGTAGENGSSAFICAVTTEMGISCWGDNSYGQLTTGDTTSSDRPSTWTTLW